MGARFREQRRIIYQLKKLYGVRVTLLRSFNDAIDFNSGQASQGVVTVCFKGVVLPSKNTRMAQYRQDYITSARPFTYGAIFDKKLVHLLISRRDLPTSWPVDQNTYVKITDVGATQPEQRFQALGMEEYEGNEILGLNLVRHDGALPLDSANVNVKQQTDFGENVTH